MNTQLKELATLTRIAIDACRMNDPQLCRLLAVNRFQVGAKKACDSLTGSLNDELEMVLEVRKRAAVIEGVSLGQEFMDVFCGIQKEAEVLLDFQ